MKKKLTLIALFGFYHMFMPFVMIGCGSVIDEPYDKTASAEEAEVDCSRIRNVTVECVDYLQSLADDRKQDPEPTKEEPTDEAADDEATDDTADPTDTGEEN